MNETLESLTKYIAEHLEMNEKNYPELRGASEDEILRFAVRHSALHFAKTAGKVAAASEDTDHGGEMGIEGLKSNVAESLINTLRLAEILKMSEPELVALVRKNFQKQINDHAAELYPHSVSARYLGASL